MTSHDAVALVRRALGIRRVGHAGTLDPMASGLLVMGVGRTARLLRFLGDLPKVYLGTGLLGVETDTLDAQGRVTRTAAVPPDLGTDRLAAALRSLTGEIEQVPPAYSAVKVRGERLYRAARRGETVEAPPRRVRVDAFDLLAFVSPSFDFRVECSGGTYVRRLVADAGDRLGCGAHLTALRRTSIGPFDVAAAGPPEAPGRLLPPGAAVAHLPLVEVGPDEAAPAAHGRGPRAAGIPGPYRLVGPDHRLIGVFADRGDRAAAEVVLA